MKIRFRLLLILAALVLAGVARATTMIYPVEAIDDLWKLPADQFREKYAGINVTGLDVSDEGWYVRYRHENLTYFFGPIVEREDARKKMWDLESVRDAAIRNRPALSSSQIDFVKFAYSGVYGARGNTPFTGKKGGAGGQDGSGDLADGNGNGGRSDKDGSGKDGTGKGGKEGKDGTGNSDTAGANGQGDMAGVQLASLSGGQGGQQGGQNGTKSGSGQNGQQNGAGSQSGQNGNQSGQGGQGGGQSTGQGQQGGQSGQQGGQSGQQQSQSGGMASSQGSGQTGNNGQAGQSGSQSSTSGGSGGGTGGSGGAGQPSQGGGTNPLQMLVGLVRGILGL